MKSVKVDQVLSQTVDHCFVSANVILSVICMELNQNFQF